MKRLFDITLSLFLIILLLIPLIIISFLILMDSGAPIIYNSKRIGFKSKKFLMPKFRTMKNGTIQVATSKMKKPYLNITRIGGFLRSYSLDELPQLFLVLVGKMSFVGPRPLLFNQYKLIKKRQLHKIDFLVPGITGLAQVNGRDFLSDEKKIYFDQKYLKSKSFFLDIKIIFKTFLVIFKKSGIKH